MTEQSVFSRGLEDVVVGESSICSIDGKNSKLAYRGYDIHDLCENSTFEEAAYLLLNGELPSQQAFSDFKTQLARDREIPGEVAETIRRFPKTAHPMAALRSSISLLSFYDPEANDKSMESQRRKAVRLIAKTPALVAYAERVRKGLSIVHPKLDAGLGTAANFLYMLKGKDVVAVEQKMLDKYFVLLAEHDLNASTFAARVVASTEADMYSAITAAIGALKGDLHGSANSRAMESIIAIGDVRNTERHVDETFAAKKKFMGFGHRVYKGPDPRAADLKEMAKTLAQHNAEQAKWYAISESLERAVWEKKQLYCNVDFYSASVLYTVGIPIDLFTTMFAISRMSGWTAHLLEQYADNRLLRPVSQYIGKPARNYIPIEKRQAAP